MRPTNYYNLMLLISFCCTKYLWAYEIAPPTVTTLDPKGFELSIPHTEDTMYVVFEGQFLNGSDFGGRVNSNENGRWVFRDKSTKLGPANGFKYWIHVYHRDDNFLSSGECHNDNYNGDMEMISFSCKNSIYEIPLPSVKQLHPKGFELSIPHIEGTKYVVFEGQFKNGVKFARRINNRDNGRWVFRDEVTELVPDYSFKYWIQVYYKDKNYSDNGECFHNNYNELKFNVCYIWKIVSA